METSLIWPFGKSWQLHAEGVDFLSRGHCFDYHFACHFPPPHLSAVGVMGNTAESETTRHSCFWANHKLLFGCHHVLLCQLCCQGFSSLARMCQEHYAEWGLPLFTPTGIQHGLWI